jgi:hypothetical protein
MNNPAVAARVRQLAAQAGHRRAIAEFHTRRAADQQARVDALLLEAIAALASLLGAPGPHPSPAVRPHIATDTCQNMNTECCRFMCKQRGR